MTGAAESERRSDDSQKPALTDALRMLVFFELVHAQDEGEPVAASRTRIAKAHGLTEQQVLAIENEGIAANWAPL